MYTLVKRRNVQIWSDLACYEALQMPYDSEHTNKQLFDVLEPMSDYVWKKRFSAESGKMAGGVLLYEWQQLLKQSEEQWRNCEKHPDECGGADHLSLCAISRKFLPELVFCYRVTV